MPQKDSAEKAVRDIRRKTRRKFSAEEKIRIVLEGLRGQEMRFDSGKILNGRFSQYPVPRFSDVPELDTHLLDRPDLDSAGGGETPMIAIAPAIANAVFDATGVRVRSMPTRDAAPRKT